MYILQVGAEQWEERELAAVIPWERTTELAVAEWLDVSVPVPLWWSFHLLLITDWAFWTHPNWHQGLLSQGGSSWWSMAQSRGMTTRAFLHPPSLLCTDVQWCWLCHAKPCHHPLWLTWLHLGSRCRPTPIPSSHQPVAHPTKSGESITFWFHLIVGSNDLLRAVTKLPRYNPEQETLQPQDLAVHAVQGLYYNRRLALYSLAETRSLASEDSVQHQALTPLRATNHWNISSSAICHKMYSKSPKQQGFSSKGLNQKGFWERRSNFTCKGCQKFIADRKVKGAVVMNPLLKSEFIYFQN